MANSLRRWPFHGVRTKTFCHTFLLVFFFFILFYFFHTYLAHAVGWQNCGRSGVFACHFGAATTHKDATWRKVCLRACVCVCVCGWFLRLGVRYFDTPAVRLRALVLGARSSDRQTRRILNSVYARTCRTLFLCALCRLRCVKYAECVCIAILIRHIYKPTHTDTPQRRRPPNN